MSTENTFLSEVKFSEKYYGTIDESAEFFKNEAISNLIKSWDNDVPLRRFFVDFTFPMVFNNDHKDNDDNHAASNLFDFIKSTRGHLHIISPEFKDDIFKFFIDMHLLADRVFNDTIMRDCDNVCERAENLGLLEPKTYVVNDRGIISFVPKEHLNGSSSILGVFYKILPDLFELWVKPANKGTMLEAWIYNILEVHFSNRDIFIIPRVKLRMQDERAKEAEGIKALTALFDERSESFSSRYDLTDLDCVIMDKNTNKPIIVIECKTTNDTGQNTLLHLYGVVELLDADEGILVISNENTFKTDQKFEKIQIIPNVVNRTEFPQILIDHLERKLREKGL